MNDTQIFLPVALLALWTLLILIALGLSRVQAVRAGKARAGFYRYYEGESGEPDWLKGIGRHYHNLLELPVLFYAGALSAWALGIANGMIVQLAWAFFGLRLLHSLIHLVSNRVPLRFLAFLGGAIVLVLMWVEIILRLFAK